MVNSCLDQLKKKKIHFEEINDRLEVYEEETPEPKYNMDKLKLALVNLAPGYRTVFNLYAIEGYDHKEIAEILQTSEANSKSQYSRAKQQLRKYMSESRSI